MIGSRLAHFRITAKLGEGGMGEVWRAEDTRLGREVAIKVLPEAFVSDAERLARFEREARVLASLSHPSIAGIHEVGEEAGIHYLVMELAPGETLAERLARGPIPVDEVLPMALQIAEALEAAHERGIVHRDLKPANVKVDAEGRVKILDFGLARALEPEAGSGAAAELTRSPTLSYQATAAGVLLGTAAYMSPEQARAKPADKRSDIWAFGVLLYELLTGRPAFEGETITDVLAAVVRAEPDLSRLPEETPFEVRRLIARCLEKDPRRRLRDIGEGRVALDDAIHGTAPLPVPSAPAPSARAFPWLRASAFVLAAGLVALLVAISPLSRRIWPERAPSMETRGAGLDPSLAVRRVTFEPGLENEPSISPDGNYIAYTSDERGNLDIVVQPVQGGNPTYLVDHPADDAQPAWSPDGSRIAFASARDRGGRLALVSGLGPLTPFVFGVGADIFLVPARGGPAVKLVEDGSHPAWSPDGSRIAFQSNRGGSWDIWTVPARGGAPARLTDDPHSDYQPAWSPDGRWIAYGSQEGLSAVPAGGGEPLRLGDAPPRTFALSPAWSPDGRWIYFSARFGDGGINLWRVPFEGQAADRRPQPRRVTLGEGADVEVAIGPGSQTIAHSTVQFAPDLWELDPASGEMRQLTDFTSLEDYPQLGPDGRTLALFSDRGGHLAIWTLDRDTGAMQLVSPEGVAAQMPRWSPDGRRLAYLAFGEQGSRRAVVQAPGQLSLQEIVAGERPQDLVGVEWSPDGQRLVLGLDGNIWTFTLDGQGTQLTDGPATDIFPDWSPDGEWITFQREEGGPRQIWVVRADGTDARRITGDDETEYSHPQWSPADPDAILVVVDHKNVATVSARTGEVKPLTSFDASTIVVDYPSWSPDGSLVHFSLSRRRGDIYLMERRSSL